MAMKPDDLPGAFNLPDYDAPTVTLFLEQLKRFREEFGHLAEFAALVLDKDIKKMCGADFGVWLLNQPDDVKLKAPGWLKSVAYMMIPSVED